MIHDVVKFVLMRCNNDAVSCPNSFVLPRFFLQHHPFSEVREKKIVHRDLKHLVIPNKLPVGPCYS